MKLKNLVNTEPLPKPTVQVEDIIPAADKLAQFLKDNNIVLIPTVLDSQCSILDGGILLNDKPLIKIKVMYKE